MENSKQTSRTIAEELEIGSMAVEMGLLDGDALLGGIRAWTRQSVQSLREILIRQSGLETDDLSLVEALLDQRKSPEEPPSEAADTAFNSVTDALLGPSDAQERWDVEPSSTTRFQSQQLLARGGLGVVFVGHDQELERTVAIKELDPDYAHDPWAAARFHRESALTASLEHPAIVPIYGRGVRADGTPFYAMRKIDGQTLREVAVQFHQARTSGVAGNRREFRKLMGYLIAVSEAIEHAHSRGIIHRDLKPSNVIVGEHGETMLIDWGLAREIDDSTREQSEDIESSPRHDLELTLRGSALGTLAYMSPEQARGERNPTTATDIFGLGGILYFLLTGSPPRPGTDREILERQASAGEIDEQRLHSRQVSRPLAAICRKAMSLHPESRYDSAASFSRELENYLADEPVSAFPESVIAKFRRWARAHQTLVTGAITALIISLAAMGILLQVLAGKNEVLRQAIDREAESTRLANQSADEAKRNGEEASRQRERVFGVLNTFLFEVERGLADIPGSAAVQRNVLKVVLQQLAQISGEVAHEDRLSLSKVTALVDLANLFSRIGTSDIQLDLPQLSLANRSPLDAAEAIYLEALQVAQRLPSASPETRRLIAQIQQKQADIMVQTSRSSQAVTLLQSSLQSCRELSAETPDSIDAVFDVVNALDSLGKIMLETSDLDQALALFSEAETLVTFVVQQQPDQPNARRKLGIAKSRIGDVAVRQGNLELAARCYQEDLDIALDLYAARPGELTPKRDICTALDRMGNIELKRGRVRESLDFISRSRQMRQELHQAEPTSLKAMHELLISCFTCGDVRMMLREIDEARRDYLEATTLANEMARLDPSSAVARRFQSMSAEVLADIAIAQGDLDEALRYSKRALEMSLKLAEMSPTTKRLWDDVIVGYLQIAKVHIAKEEYDAGLEQLRLALPMVKKSFDENPGELESASSYGIVLLKIAEAELRSNRAVEAVESCRSFLQIMESVPASNRQDAVLRRRMVNALTILGRAQLVIGAVDEAVVSLEQARQDAEAMVRDNVRKEQMEQDLIEINELLAIASKKRL